MTIWGASAVNGIISIFTKKADDTHGGMVEVGGGNIDAGSVLRTAVDWGYIEANPAHGMRLPARQPKDVVFLPRPEQVAQILKQLPEPSYTLMLLLVGTGVRVGEAIGLRWEDIDLNRKDLTVRRDI
jgi:integrase